jgi:uracil-DNA glycosylase
MTAALALVGEAPGRTEDEGGQPFIGASGRLLFRLIGDELRLTRSQCYVTNVVKCRPPANRTPTNTEITACRPWWDEQASLLQARVIMTLGNTSTRALLGITAGISTVRGQVFAFDGRALVPTFHPAAALRGGPSVEAMMRADMRVVAAILTDAIS